MDGGSTDGSVEILERFPSVRWSSEPDRGQSHAINKAFRRSKGEIIGWLNSDDAYFHREVVARVVDLFSRRPEVAVVYGHAALANADGLILQLIWTPPFSYRLLRRYNFIVQPAAFIRRTVVDGNLADEDFDYMMDRELWLRLGQNHPFARIDDVLAIDRHHALRKSYERLDLARADRKRLANMYGVPVGPLTRARLRATKIPFRLLGVRLLPLVSQPLAFCGGRDSMWRLALRQVSVKRAAMPEGSSDRFPHADDTAR
jgi:glycosyltransferase involved in cell wall biosynthesis